MFFFVDSAQRVRSNEYGRKKKSISAQHNFQARMEKKLEYFFLFKNLRIFDAFSKTRLFFYIYKRVFHKLRSYIIGYFFSLCT